MMLVKVIAKYSINRIISLIDFFGMGLFFDFFNVGKKEDSHLSDENDQQDKTGDGHQGQEDQQQGEHGNEQSRPSPKNPNRTALLIVILLIVIFSVSFFYNNVVSYGKTNITYSQFLQYLDAGNIVSVTIIEGREIQGRLRNEGTLFSTLIPYQDGNLIKKLEESGVTFTGANKPITFLQIISTALPWLVSIIFILFMLRSLKGFSGGSMPFVKGKVRTYVRDNEKKVMFSNVAGQAEAKYELKEVVEFLMHPEKFQEIGARIPRGVLLVGAPGTGKTLLARACAGEAQVSFFYMSGSDFVEMFAGVGASRVRELFDKGRKSSPCIVFIDELDAVGRSRSSGMSGGVNDEREQTLNQLLVEMDGFETRDRIIVLAATNRPDILDKALLRPGRFDRQVVVDMPDLAEREEILKIHSKDVKIAETIDLNHIARATVGCSGADLANLVNEAALFAARRGKAHVEPEDLEEARDKILMGAARKSKVISPDEKLRTARHESGHALLHLLLENSDPLHKVTIIPRGRALGVAFSLPENDTYGRGQAYLIDRIAICYGGFAAETIYYNETSTGVQNDLQQATQIASHMVKDWGMSKLGPISYSDREHALFLPVDSDSGIQYSDETSREIDKEIQRILHEGLTAAQTLLQTHKDKLDIVTTELIKHETLLGEQVHELLGIASKSKKSKQAAGVSI